MLRFLITVLIVVLLLSSLAQDKKDPGGEWAEALVKWDTDCRPGGCILETDILRGYSDDSADPKDSREYISIYVAVERATQKPAYFAFHVDPRAQQNNGIFITFSKTKKNGASWKMNLDPEGVTRLMFDKCGQQSCVVRIPNGLVQEGKESHQMNLLDKFLGSNHLLILYMKHGKTYRTMVILSSFQRRIFFCNDF